MLPDFLIVGGMKCGTTSLLFYLNQHPSICMPEKELHYFDKDNNYKKGLNWYEDQFKCKSDKVIGEKTPTYSYLKKVPKRINESIPEIKLIWIFRDPVKRAYSNYWHAVNNGVEYLSFEEAIKREPERVKQDVFKGYLRRSKYYNQVKNYLEYFDKGQMLFLIAEKLFEAPLEELERVYKFLEIDEKYKDSVEENLEKNVTFTPHSKKLLYLFRNFLGDSSFFNIIKKLMFFKSDPGYPPMSKAIERKLYSEFSKHNKKFEKLIERDISCWKEL